MTDPLRVLVVDDEDALAQVVASYLEREGFHVQVAHDGPGAVTAARDEEVDTVVGLAVGADDYLVKPFSPPRADRPCAGHAASAPDGRKAPLPAAKWCPATHRRPRGGSGFSDRPPRSPEAPPDGDALGGHGKVCDLSQ